ncbi:MAG TPA: DUF881 domain-containing protein [Candidatus Dormibacteraeota bacterium]
MINVRKAGAYLLVALTALAFGYLLAAQLRTQLLVPGNRVARTEALVRTVQDLEQANSGYRSQIATLQAQIDALEAQAGQRSGATQSLRDQVALLRAHAGATSLRGPGVTVALGNGQPGAGATDYLVNFQDIQDVVNLLFEAGAEGVAVNGHRISPLSSFSGPAGTVVIDQGNPLYAPFQVTAVGNRNQMEQKLGDASNLGGLRNRQRAYGLALSFQGSPDLTLPAYDSTLEVRYAQPA